MNRQKAKKPEAKSLSCPSAPPEWEGARLIGVVGGSVAAPEVTFMDPRPVTDELLALADPVTPTEVFRFTAPCQESACSHFKNGKCGVATAVMDHVTSATDKSLPECPIRTSCRWWEEQGPEACRKCRFVVTDDAARNPEFETALRP